MDNPPQRLGHFSATVNGDHYVFGGLNDDFSEENNLVYSLHILEKSWKPSETKGELPPALYQGACTSYGRWISTEPVGEIPPPCCNFSFTKIDSDKVLLFGGFSPETGKTNDVYWLDLRSMRWYYIADIEGPKPPERDAHAAACVGFGGEHPQLLISGGLDVNEATLNDVWLLDFNAKRWKLIKQHHKLSRCFHGATAINPTPMSTEVVMFGGSQKYSSLFQSDYDHAMFASTYVLLFEYECSGDASEWILVEEIENLQLRRQRTPHSHNSTIGDLVVSFHEKIGSGAFATVYKAVYRGDVCAAKVLSQAATHIMIGDSQNFVQDSVKEAIKRECSFLKDLRHENVIQHISTAIEPNSGLPILVMELMDCSLKKFIPDYRPIDINMQLTFCLGVSSGLHYLHSKSIIHRDLCDDNILLMRPPAFKVKISDFGMSRILDYNSISTRLTAVGHRKGYLPREAMGFDDSSDSESDDIKDPCYSHRMDIYSFGAVAAQVVMSANSFKSRGDLKKALKKIPEEHPLKGIISECTNKDSKQRPKRVQFVRDRIDSLI